MTRSELSAVFSMPPAEAVVWLRSKKLQISFDYREVWGEAHQRTFAVAKVMKLDLLKDLHDSLTRALEKGIPFKEWHENIRPTLAAKGWYGRREIVNPETGEVKTITIGARRLSTIYETNLRSAYNHGRWVHQRRSPSMEYWRYTSALLPTTRPSHRAMHGRVYPRNHPFWDANYPPNGYNCKCKVRAYSKKMLERRGWKVSDDYEPIADPGFAHPPGNSLSQVWKERILDLPGPIKKLGTTEKKISDLYDSAFEKDKELSQAFMRHKPAMIVDPGAPIRNDAAYSIEQKVMIFKKIPDLRTFRHESAHALDHAYGFISRGLLPSLQSDVSAYKDKRAEIKALLTSGPREDDFYLHDLFYLSSDGWVGYKTREDPYMTDFAKHAEAFAVLMEAYLSGTNLGIIQRYYPDTWRTFLELLAQVKETP